MTQENNTFTFASLFAGIGGICTAFKNAGFELSWANEYDAHACQTYSRNIQIPYYDGSISTPYLIHHDITKICLNPDSDLNEIDLTSLPKVDILTSGFPCQAFSVAGYREGFEDSKGRGNLFFDTVRFIQEIKPQAFLLENVKGLVSHDNGNTFRVIRDIISSNQDTVIEVNASQWNGLGYSFIPFVLNSIEYSEIPQTRSRIYIVGFKNEAWIHNNQNHSALNVSPSNQPSFTSLEGFANTKTSKFFIPSKVSKTKPVQTLLEPSTQDDFYIYDSDHKYYPILAPEVTDKTTLYQWRRHYVRKNQSNACPTLTANMGTGGHNVPIVLDSLNRIRKLTPKECLNFQGFPASYSFPSDIAKSHCYKQAGNSVVVPVIESIAANIKVALE